MSGFTGLAELVRGLREQRARTTVTILGIAWGTFSVVVLLAFGLGLQGHLRSKAINLGRSIGIVWPQRTTRAHGGIGRGRPILLRAEDIVRLPSQIRELELVSPEYISRERVRVGSRVYRATLSGVYPAYGDLRTWRIQSGGRFLNDIDIEGRRRVAVLGDRIAAGLFRDRAAVGESLVLRGIPLTVVGVLAPKPQDSNYSGMDADRICLPATTFEQVFGARFISNFVYRARSLEAHARATDGIYRALGRSHGFDPADRQALNVWDTTEEERILHYVFLGFNLMLGASGVLTLLVGAVGVGNLLFIRVRQRAREIGIQMAVGAKPRTILLDVLCESLLIVGAGGALGIGLAWLITEVAARSPATEHIGLPRISPSLAVLTVLILGAVGLVAGYFPARRAAGLDPVRALAE